MSETSRLSDEHLASSAPGAGAAARLDEHLAASTVIGASRLDESIGGIIIPDEPTITILSVSFDVTRTTITVRFETSESSRCRIIGGVYDPEAMYFTTWHENAVEHGTAHEHKKSGLTQATRYAIRIEASTDELASTCAPGIDGYYIVETASAEGTGGGLRSIVY